MIGDLLGEYRVTEKLGEGGMGTVYRALDQMLERDVALKLLRPDVSDQPELVDRFRTEAVILGKLTHPNIATLYRLTRERGSLLMVMEYVPGQTLARLLARVRRLPLLHACAWCCQALDAMDYAHDLGVVHRDLKPANLMVTDSGIVKVTDFGIARALGTGRQTRFGFVIGTPAYMSPEQVRGQEVDGRSDIYSLGAVLFELVTGRTPFVTDDEFGTLAAHIQELPPRPSSLRPGLPDWIDEVVLTALAKSPAERYPTAADFRASLEAGLVTIGAGQDDTSPLDLPAPRQRATTTPRMARPDYPARRDTPGERRVPAAGGASPAPPAAPMGAPSAARRILARLAASIPGTRGRVSWRSAVIGVVVALVAVASVLALVGRRGGGGQVGAPAPDSARAGSTPAIEASRPAAPLVPLATTTGAAPAEPVSATSSAPVAPDGTAVSAARPGVPAKAPERAVPTAPRASAPAPPVRRDPVPTEAPRDRLQPVPVPEASPASLSRGAAAPVAPLSFSNIKMLVVDGQKSREEDALLQFDAERLVVTLVQAKSVAKAFAYPSIRSAVYAQSRHPRWKEGLGTAVLVGVFAAPVFFMKSTKHWLTIQTPDDFVVLRLDKRNFQSVLPAFETRTGVKVEVDKGQK